VLADEPAISKGAGRLSDDLHLPTEWRASLIAFIADTLPSWRDDPLRPAATAETVLTAQLCALLNSASRKSRGWDYLQFRMEEPDEVVRGRAIDLVAAPLGQLIWIDGRRYSHYEPMLPLECKRLPTPTGRERDEREYLYSRHGSRGGVQRFKAGDHGAAHAHAAIIAYLQTDDIPTWHARVEQWIVDLSAETTNWSGDDQVTLNIHDSERGLARLSSNHARDRGLSRIAIDHIWIRII
jgi:hypothetical protein